MRDKKTGRYMSNKIKKVEDQGNYHLSESYNIYKLNEIIDSHNDLVKRVTHQNEQIDELFERIAEVEDPYHSDVCGSTITFPLPICECGKMENPIITGSSGKTTCRACPSPKKEEPKEDIKKRLDEAFNAGFDIANKKTKIIIIQEIEEWWKKIGTIGNTFDDLLKTIKKI